MTPITRLHYRECQRLRTADLADEQLYLVQARRRHNITHHVWGIVWGLALANDKVEGLVVQPGIAIDGYGRELIVPIPLHITSQMMTDLGTDWGHSPTLVDVWLVYNEVTYTPPQRGRAENWNNTRISETTCLRFTDGIDEEVTTADSRQAYDVPEENLDFQPWQTPPDDWINPWPVYLGQLTKSDGGGYEININNRPYAELMGERVTTPSGQGWMELLDNGSITRRFSLNLSDSNTVISKRLNVQYSDSRQETQATIWGNPTISGENGLKIGDQPNIRPNTTPDARGLNFGIPRPTPEQATPWQIYRTQFKPKDAPPETKPIDQLRIEVFDPGDEGDQTAYGLSIGYSDIVTEQYHSCLRLSANCTVEVGEVVVYGEILESPIPADPKDPRFAEAMLGMWLKGISEASNLLDKRFSGGDGQSSSVLEIVLNGLNTNMTKGFPIPYTATLTNKGTTTLAMVQTTEFVTYTQATEAGTPLHTAPIGDPIAIIQPSTSKVLNPHTIPSQQNGQLLVAIVASAVTPGGRVIIGTAMKLVNIVDIVEGTGMPHG